MPRIPNRSVSNELQTARSYTLYGTCVPKQLATQIKISFELATYTGEYTVIQLSTKAPNVPVRDISTGIYVCVLFLVTKPPKDYNLPVDETSVLALAYVRTMVRNRHLILFVAFVFLLSAWTRKGVLDTVTRSEHKVEGSYIDFSSERGIRFTSTPQTLFIETIPGGEPLLSATEPAGSMRLVSIGSSVFIQSDEANSLDYSVQGEQYNISEFSTDHEGLQRLKNMAVETSEIVHLKALYDSLQYLLSRPEVQLIEYAAHAMGEEGINGQDSSSVLAFYLAALHLHKLQHAASGSNHSMQDHHALQPNSFTPNHLSMRGKRHSNSCFNTCPPCQGKQCLGLCGLNCHCWKFVCGDCCWHLGCYEHDLCCREKFIHTKCLLPFNFQCESSYKC